MKNRGQAGLVIGIVLLLLVVTVIFYFVVYYQEEDMMEVERIFCTPEDRNSDACAAIYSPVCGALADNTFQTYSNGCVACSNEEVIFWVQGECSE